MKKTLLIVLGTLFTLAGSTFAHGSTYTGSTGTGSGTGTNSGAVYLSICINDAALIQNTALLGVNTTYVNAIKAASVKLQTAIDVAKASGKTDAEIQVMITSSFVTWRSDVKAAKTVANDARKVAKTNFDTAKAACKEKYKAYVEVKHDGNHDNRKDKDGKYENNKSKNFGLRINLMKKHFNKDHK